MATGTRLRVFISYNHDYMAFASRLEKALEANGLDAIRDERVAEGRHFPDAVLHWISHAHVFMPVIPPGASTSGWVHQEIGYAAALHVPVLPVCLGDVPSGMIDRIKVAQVSDGMSVRALRGRFPLDNFENLVADAQAKGVALYEAARDTRRRADMLADYCRTLTREGICAVVRQRATLSSFHIPTQLPGHRYWRLRHGKTPPDEDYCTRLTRERKALEEHAAEGCRLLINPEFPFTEHGEVARAVRCRVLLDFLETRSPANTVVGILRMSPESLTIVGDWFSARALSGNLARGIRLTAFTRHAPTVMTDIDEFEEELRYARETNGVSEGDSLSHAVGKIREILRSLPPIPGD